MQVMPEGIVMQLLGYSLDRLRDDGELILYRAHAKPSESPVVLLLVPASTRPSLETLKKIHPEPSLWSELDSAWVVRPPGLSERDAQIGRGPGQALRLVI
jgi:hypothetical protein